MNRRLLGFCVSVGLVLLAACGGDDEPESKPSAQRKPDERETGDPKGMVAASGGAAGSAIAVPPLGTLPSIECKADAESEAMCGDTTCPELPQTSAASCMVTCCTDAGKCGVRSSAIVGGLAVPSLCVESAVPDPRCPSSSVGAMTLPGCCDFMGHCGTLVGTVCLSSGAGTEPACDASSAD